MLSTAPSRVGRGLRWGTLLVVGALVGWAFAPGPDGEAHWRGWLTALRSDPAVATANDAGPRDAGSPDAPHDASSERPSELAEALEPLPDEFELHRVAPEPSLQDRLVTDVYEVHGAARASQTIAIPFDPEGLVQPTVYQVVDGVLAFPVPATFEGPVAHVRAEVSLPPTTEGPAFLQATGRGAPAPPPRVGYAIGDYWHPRCVRGARGEVEHRRGERIAIGYLADADCQLGREVAALLEEALTHYGDEFADAGGSPLRRYTADAPLLVHLREQPGVNGSYSLWSTRGHMNVDIASARNDAAGLRETLFHETFHAVQDHYANLAATGVLGSHWWFEGSAEWAGLVARGVDFDAAIPIELRESGILSVDLARTTRYGTMSYATSLHMFWAERRNPGFVRQLLQSDTFRGGAFVQATHEACGFPEAYPAFLEHVLRVAPDRPWARARFMVGDTGIRRQIANEPNAALPAAPINPWADPIDDTRVDRPWRTESVYFVAAPYTAHFVQLFVRASEPVRLSMSSTTPNVRRVGGNLRAEGEGFVVDPLVSTTFVFFNDHPTENRAIEALLFFEYGEEPEEPEPEPERVAPPPPEPPPRRPEPAPRMRAEPRTGGVASLSGAWSFPMGCMNLEQSGSSVTGEVFGHRHEHTGRVRGTVREGVAELRFSLGDQPQSLRVHLSMLQARAENRGPGAHRFTRVRRCARAADNRMSCYDACLRGCAEGMMACGIDGEQVPPARYCDGIQSQPGSTRSGLGFFFECLPNMPAAWRRPRSVPIPGTRSLVPQVNPNGRARRR